ncbi:DUF2478 domain-containing protein [Methylobacterium sp. BTF04]|uniref:DUF2478 domain-containing protein n=1 Tax=Methylobacterium sp. BTF04 TaxID=2708300 RepID=UPI0013D755EA|nr:DUF2478 domain-containing protein [Methylobacterium sp. BTF04]
MKPILALQGASNLIIQGALASCVARWSGPDTRIVGVIEVRDEAARDPAARDRLQDLRTGVTYPIYQDLGPGSTACRLHTDGIIAACEAVRLQIRSGCDLVVLSKFGKLEAARSGLSAAFASAVEAETPILTAVAPLFVPAWQAFAGPLAEMGAPDAETLDGWWQAVRRPRVDGRPRPAGPTAP